VQLVLATEVVHYLELAHDCRHLEHHEEELRKHLKLKSLGLVSLQRMIARQESRLLWLKEGYAPTRFFHIQASCRVHKIFIQALEYQGQVLIVDDHKTEVVVN
jgi:hypothetical protein